MIYLIVVILGTLMSVSSILLAVHWLLWFHCVVLFQFSVDCNEKALNNLISCHRCTEQTAQSDKQKLGIQFVHFLWVC